MALIEAALAAIRTKDSALAARYRRVMRHRGHKKAVVAVAHAILRAIYHILTDHTPYRDPGPNYYDRRHAHRVTRPGCRTARASRVPRGPRTGGMSGSSRSPVIF